MLFVTFNVKNETGIFLRQLTYYVTEQWSSECQRPCFNQGRFQTSKMGKLLLNELKILINVIAFDAVPRKCLVWHSKIIFIKSRIANNKIV